MVRIFVKKFSNVHQEKNLGCKCQIKLLRIPELFNILQAGSFLVNYSPKLAIDS